MGERWVPVLAGVLGILGGMGGAAVGGYVANKGQERFEQEQATQIRNLRIATYVKFLRAAQNEYDGQSVPDRIVLVSEAEVVLVAPNDEVREAATLLTEMATAEKRTPEAAYEDA